MKPRPALRYFGGKWRLAPWIIGHFPDHVCYVEPFCGAASVFLRKRPAQFEVINDLDGEVVNFFRMLRDRTDEFIYAIQATPYSRREYELAWEWENIGSELDPLERARLFYIRSWQGWAFREAQRGRGDVVVYPTWRIQHSNNRGKSVITDWNKVDHLPALAGRLKMAFIENDDAIDIIGRYDRPETLFYLDPPYLSELRSERWRRAYHCEVDRDYHVRLLDLLMEIRGMAIISGYPSGLYNETLAGWHRFETRSRTTNTSNPTTEVIWVSPSATEARLPLFQNCGV